MNDVDLLGSGKFATSGRRIVGMVVAGLTEGRVEADLNGRAMGVECPMPQAIDETPRVC